MYENMHALKYVFVVTYVLCKHDISLSILDSSFAVFPNVSSTFSQLKGFSGSFPHLGLRTEVTVEHMVKPLLMLCLYS